MKQREFSLNGNTVWGVEIPLPGAPIVLVYGKTGYVMCGYLNIEVSNKFNGAAAIVRGVNTIDELLNAPVQVVSVEAQKKGVQVGDSGQVALQKILS